MQSLFLSLRRNFSVEFFFFFDVVINFDDASIASNCMKQNVPPKRTKTKKKKIFHKNSNVNMHSQIENCDRDCRLPIPSFFPLANHFIYFFSSPFFISLPSCAPVIWFELMSMSMYLRFVVFTFP